MKRQQLAPLVSVHLIAYSSFLDGAALAVDGSGMADWSVHGAVRLSSADPPPVAAGGGEPAGGTVTEASAGGSSAGSAGGGGSLAADGLLIVLGLGAWRRCPRR